MFILPLSGAWLIHPALLLSSCLFSVGMENARIIPRVDFHSAERGLAFELSQTEASSLFLYLSPKLHPAQGTQTYGVSCKEGDVKGREERRREERRRREENGGLRAKAGR